jgi:RNA-directed DNA polymerase
MKLTDIFTIKNLYEAHKRTRKGKLYKNDVISFELNKADEIYKLYEQIRSKTYRVSPYKTFYIFEPKKRRVDATLYKDRIVQNCFVENYFGPLLENRLIYDNAACRKEKGTDFARNRLKKFLLEAYKKYKLNFYVLSFDIHHYFESIDHEVLKTKLSKIILDEEIKEFLCMIIDSFNKEEGKGLPLGNQTSQWFALYYLDHLDRTIKEKYRIKYYSRYMDDGIIISDDLELLKKLNVTLKEELEEVKLTMNEKKNHISSIKQGVTYLGFTYHLNENGKLIVKMASKKKKRLIRYLNKYDLKEESLKTYYNYLKKNSTNNYSMMKRIYKKLDF